MGTLRNIPSGGFTRATPRLHAFTPRTFHPRLFGWNASYWQKHPLEITWQVSQYFVDRPRVMKAMLRAKKAPLVKAGAYIRRTARRSMRNRKKSSVAPMPPHAHSREPNLRTIFFAWDQIVETVVVGPVLFRKASDGGGKVPRVHEKGGRIRVKFRNQKKPLPVRYPARPYMVPALKAEAPKFPGLWEHSVRP